MKNWKKISLLWKMIVDVSPVYPLLLILNVAVTVARTLCGVLLPAALVEELTGARIPGRVLFLAVLVVGANALMRLLGNRMDAWLETERVWVSNMMEERLGEKIMRLPYMRLEETSFLELKDKARLAISSQDSFVSLLNSLVGLLQSGGALLSVAAVICTLSPLLAVVLLCVAGLTIVVVKRENEAVEQLIMSVVPMNRVGGYYGGLTENREIQKDVRLYDLSEMVAGTAHKWMKEVFAEFDRGYSGLGVYEGLIETLNILQTAIAYGYVGIRVLSDSFGGRISLGSFTMYVSAATQFASGVSGVGNSLTNVRMQLDFLEPFLELMSMPQEQESSGGVPFEEPVETVEFSHVDFAYPGSDRKVLQDISFKVNKGEKISIVGLNGAGKTTLIKLLCRLYRPQSGRILVNGREIGEYNYDSYMGQLAAVFQDYRLFAFSIGENISCRASGEDEARIRKLVEQTGLGEKLDSLPEGLHTLLGKEYDRAGTEVSGGQNQKIAIARALYKDASLIILDEPTSALDPIAEAEIYENFNQLAGGRTALYISHRMSSSVFCDRILVIDGGAVSDFDTHENLMKKTDSLYYKLFHSQAENYAVE